MKKKRFEFITKTSKIAKMFNFCECVNFRNWFSNTFLTNKINMNFEDVNKAEIIFQSWNSKFVKNLFSLLLFLKLHLVLVFTRSLSVHGTAVLFFALASKLLTLTMFGLIKNNTKHKKVQWRSEKFWLSSKIKNRKSP